MKRALLLVACLGCGARAGLNVPEPEDVACDTAADCDNGLYCDGLERCNDHRCVPAEAGPCPRVDDPCLVARCEETTRQCSSAPRTEDRDRDGHREAQAGLASRCGDDCDDRDPAVHPGQAERCNGRDDDCNGVIDDGAQLSPTGVLHRVSPPALSPAGPAGLAWQGDHYIASEWAYSQGKARIYLNHLDRDGVSVAPREALTSAVADAFGAQLVAQGQTLGAVWQDRRDPGGGYEIYFQHLAPNGARSGPDLRVTRAPGFSGNPAMVATSAGFVIVWQDDRDQARSGHFSLYLQAVSADGRLVGANQRLTTPGPDESDESPAIARGASRVAVAFMRAGPRGRRVYLVPLDEARHLPRSLSALSPPDESAVQPGLQALRDGFMVTWYEDRAEAPRRAISARWLDHEGVALSAPSPLVAHPNAFVRSPALLSQGDRALLVWADDHRAQRFDLWANVFRPGARFVAEPHGALALTPSVAESASVAPVLARGPEGDVGVFFRDNREGHIGTWFTALRCSAQ